MLRPDGWAGYEPVDSDLPAAIKTTPVVCTGKNLRVCADVKKNGYVKIKLLDSYNKLLPESKAPKRHQMMFTLIGVRRFLKDVLN